MTNAWSTRSATVVTSSPATGGTSGGKWTRPFWRGSDGVSGTRLGASFVSVSDVSSEGGTDGHCNFGWNKVTFRYSGRASLGHGRTFS